MLTGYFCYVTSHFSFCFLPIVHSILFLFLCCQFPCRISTWGKPSRALPSRTSRWYRRAAFQILLKKYTTWATSRPRSTFSQSTGQYWGGSNSVPQMSGINHCNMLRQESPTALTKALKLLVINYFLCYWALEFYKDRNFSYIFGQILVFHQIQIFKKVNKKSLNFLIF